MLLVAVTVMATATARPVAADSVTSSFSYNLGALTAEGLSCDLTRYHTCGVGSFDGQPATSSFYLPTSGGGFFGDCFRYDFVDELIELRDGSGSLTLRHTPTICPPTANWWKNRGFASNGNPWHLESTWTIVSGTGVYAGASGAGTWSAFWAGWAGVGQHSGEISIG